MKVKTINRNKIRQSHHTHDKLFKVIFQILDSVIDCVRHLLPSKFAAGIDLSAFTLDDTHYVSGFLKETVSDVVWRTVQKDGTGNIALALLWEHKSYPDENICFQLNSYMNGIWQKDISEKRPKTAVIPIVFYHGKTPWDKQKMTDSFKDLAAEWQPFIPQFDYVLISVHDIPDDIILDLNKISALGALLLMFKKINDTEYLKNNAPKLFEYFANDPEKAELWRKFVAYFVYNANLEKQDTLNIIQTVLPPHIKSSAMTSYQSILDAGVKEGEAKGETKERKKAIIRMLLRGLISVPDIADTMEVSISFVVEIRDALLSDGNTLPVLIRDFKI